MSKESYNTNFKKFSKRLANYTDQDLVKAYNKEVGIIYTGMTRQAYLRALIETFDNRNIDYSLLGDHRSMSYKYVVYLKNGKLKRLENLSPAEVVIIFDNYLAHKHPDKLVLHPKIQSYDNDFIRFSLFGYNGAFKLESNKLIKELFSRKDFL